MSLCVCVCVCARPLCSKTVCLFHARFVQCSSLGAYLFPGLQCRCVHGAQQQGQMHPASSRHTGLHSKIPALLWDISQVYTCDAYAPRDLDWACLFAQEADIVDC